MRGVRKPAEADPRLLLPAVHHHISVQVQVLPVRAPLRRSQPLRSDRLHANRDRRSRYSMTRRNSRSRPLRRLAAEDHSSGHPLLRLLLIRVGVVDLSLRTTRLKLRAIRWRLIRTIRAALTIRMHQRMKICSIQTSSASRLAAPDYRYVYCVFAHASGNERLIWCFVGGIAFACEIGFGCSETAYYEQFVLF